MSFRTGRWMTFGSIVFALFAAGILSTRMATPSRATAAEANDNRIKNLRQEKLTALQAVAEMIGIFHRNGRAPYTDLVEARVAARHAELELCETDAERVAVLEKMLTEAREFEQFHRAQKEAAQGTEVEVLKAKAARLDVEVALERAKAGK